MERCSIPPFCFLSEFWLLLLLLISVATVPASCGPEDQKWGEQGSEMQTDSLHLSITPQATPTPLWAVIWGPTQPIEDETHHFLSSQETDVQKVSTSEAWSLRSVTTVKRDRQAPSLEARDVSEEGDDGKAAKETEEVDPQFYVTVTISSVLILLAVIISAKLCYDRSCSQNPPPLSRGAGPPLSLAIPRSLAQEDSRQALHSPPSFPDRER
ncbi:PILR alpha-associated neural protein [Chanos chanos]|uniref:PILR alpha-associated neural protein n=1 Tax=Chanos chanos TaxID=29144 RepID=A0A6J2WAP8_CHACN|nr:PILR alpha-associated neural protein [Chanos chanos]